MGENVNAAKEHSARITLTMCFCREEMGQKTFGWGKCRTQFDFPSTRKEN